MSLPDASRETFLSVLREDLGTIGLVYDEALLSRCAEMYELLLSWNQAHNLTRITDPATAASRHFTESLFPLTFPCLFPTGLRCADVGSGAGFPGIPLALARHDLSWTLIEKAIKKTAFLLFAKASLGLSRVTVCAKDAHAVPSRFDLVISRALSIDEKGIALLSSLLVPGGRLVLYPGRQQLSFADFSLEETSTFFRGRLLRLAVLSPYSSALH